MKIIFLKKKKMKLLTNKQRKSYENAKICYILKERFEDKHAKDRDHCPYTGEYRGAARSICNLNYHVLKETSIIFTKDLTMIISLSEKNQQKNLKNKLFVQEKILKYT